MLLHEVDDRQCDLGRLEERLGFLIVVRVHVRRQQAPDREDDEDESQFVWVCVLGPAGGGNLLGIERGGVGIELSAGYNIVAIVCALVKRWRAGEPDSLEGVEVPVKVL
jgi:hypothetical protein